MFPSCWIAAERHRSLPANRGPASCSNSLDEHGTKDSGVISERARQSRNHCRVTTRARPAISTVLSGGSRRLGAIVWQRSIRCVRHGSGRVESTGRDPRLGVSKITTRAGFENERQRFSAAFRSLIICSPRRIRPMADRSFRRQEACPR